jgi:hypothetical protein
MQPFGLRFSHAEGSLRSTPFGLRFSHAEGVDSRMPFLGVSLRSTPFGLRFSHAGGVLENSPEWLAIERVNELVFSDRNCTDDRRKSPATSKVEDVG